MAAVLESKLNITNSAQPAVDRSGVDKNDYSLAIKRSPVKDTEIKIILKAALTDRVDDHEIYTKGIDASYAYEGF